MIEWIIHWDITFLFGLNGLATQYVLLDQFMLLLSSKWASIPLYVLIGYLLYKHFGWYALLWLLIGVGVVIVITDQGSVQLFKEVFQRLRPCHDNQLSDKLVLVGGGCGGQYGFVSSHAANVFGLAAFVIRVFAKITRWWYLLLIWAMAVSISRVYLGVHYPTDIIVGAAYGAMIGLLTATLLKRIIKPI